MSESEPNSDEEQQGGTIYVSEVTHLQIESEDGRCLEWERDFDTAALRDADDDRVGLGTVKETPKKFEFIPNSIDVPRYEGVLEGFPDEDLTGWSYTITTTYRDGDETKVFVGTFEEDRTTNTGRRVLTLHNGDEKETLADLIP